MDLTQTLRDPEAGRALAWEIQSITGDLRCNLMEVCGGQTHTIYKYRLRDMLPSGVHLVSGPGCPVCVTPIHYVDQAIALCKLPGVTVFTFGDLLRVPGTDQTLEQARAEGGDVRSVYSPQAALEFARLNPGRQVVFLGIGFETTLPTFLLPLRHAEREGIQNFSLLVSAKRVPPVLKALLQSPGLQIHGFITPGHVTSIIGSDAYASLCEEFNVPMVVGGFEPLDLLTAIRDLVKQLVRGDHANANAYRRATHSQGNVLAQGLIAEFMEPCNEELRGLGVIPDAGYRLRDAFAERDATRRFDLSAVRSAEPKGCICGNILAGRATPLQCPLFGKRCTPSMPVGACMVSQEGTCNAAFQYGAP